MCYRMDGIPLQSVSFTSNSLTTIDLVYLSIFYGFVRHSVVSFSIPVVCGVKVCLCGWTVAR